MKSMAQNGQLISDDDYERFVHLHGPQLRSADVPDHLWMNLCYKLTNQVFDAGEKLSLVLVEYDDEDRPETAPAWMLSVTGAGGIQLNDVNAVYLVDHAWTYKADVARQHLEQMPSLLNRMTIMIGINDEGLSAEDRVDQVLQKMWRYNSTYTINSPGENVPIESQMPVW